MKNQPVSSANADAFRTAQTVLVGGVNSPVRSFKSVGGDPLFISRGNGQFLYNLEGRPYLDYVLSWGAMLLGHAHPRVQAALQAAVPLGTSFGAPTLAETELAKRVCACVPGLEKVRMVNSGTEAVMSLVRLARGVTGRTKIIKFKGCYHGHSDHFLVAAGSGALTLGQPSSPGVTAATVRDTLLCEFNDLQSLRAQLDAHRDDVAAILLEPVPGNMGVVLPQPGFLQAVRDLATAAGALLIFDEVMTGFRVGLGGVTERLGVRADLLALGKVLGGGLPAALYGGSAKLMDNVAPVGPIYQAGTLSGNPLAMASGLATLNELSEQAAVIYPQLEKHTDVLATGLRAAAARAGVAVVVTQLGAMLSVFFTAHQAVHSFADVMTTAVAQYKLFFHAMLAEQIFLPPSPYEAWFLSTAHTDADIARTLTAAELAFNTIKEAGKKS